MRRTIYKRERGSGYYQLTPYVVSEMLAELPSCLVLVLLFSSMVYWMTGLWGTAGQFCFFVLVQFVSLCTAQAFAMFIGALVPKYVDSSSSHITCCKLGGLGGSAIKHYTLTFT